MKLPINLRSNEKRQLDEMIPRAADLFEERELGDEAEELREATIVEEEETGMYYADVDDWRTIVSSLRVLRKEESLRSWWLRKKLAKRLSRKMDELEDEEGESADSNPTPKDEESASTAEA